MRLGRDRQQADIWLDDPKVSRRHALLERLGAALQITDLNSSNGTFVNEHRISGPTLLRPGDKVRIGDTELVVTDQAE
ncbi:MAG: FHA domain-containing protein [Chloroflexi bacterium]|nr:FHA domain-containing protein [Chloroflexota bacterium]MCI0577505.1 FHA domain-containing protein [Chloroflexota bacterium]MCI0645657.1 FHA domain-containing protein [Chloroflexota bacterium]MCI0725569.1 FHA domain-containing protein [Chloroflexota bacterium]